MNTFKEHLSSVVDCSRITNGVWKRGLLRAEFEPEEIDADKDMLYKKSSMEILGRQQQISSVDEDVYFRPRGIKDRYGPVHHPMESKEFLNIYNA